MEWIGVWPRPLKIVRVTQQIGTLNLVLTISRAKQHFLNHILNIQTFLKSPQKATRKDFEYCNSFFCRIDGPILSSWHLHFHCLAKSFRNSPTTPEWSLGTDMNMKSNQSTLCQFDKGRGCGANGGVLIWQSSQSVCPERHAFLC